ncbi:MAG: hypothetical protein L6R45_29200 [Anaerolineae bacterium]|nr:hypothetical protein [Anaerolineae bacterium]
MCQYLEIVAQIGEHQYLACCEHGAVHLGWYYGAFHLRPDDFRRVATLLEQSATPHWIELRGEGCGLIRQRNGCFQLWIGQAVLFLLEAELYQLVELVRAALPTLEQMLMENGGNSWSQPRLHSSQTKRPGDGTFSLN